jgi:hypothetical protein
MPEIRYGHEQTRTPWIARAQIPSFTRADMWLKYAPNG